MNERPQLPVEPLSEDAWARIEAASVHARPLRPRVPERKSRRHWVGAAALAAACGALGLLLGGGEPRSETRVQTNETESVVRLGEVTVTVGPQSQVVAVGSDAAGWELRLSDGAVECEVPPRAGRPPFVVLVDDVRVEVVGTRFSVERAPHPSVEVERGVVRVVEGPRTHELRAGQRWPERSQPVAAATPIESPRAETPEPPTPSRLAVRTSGATAEGAPADPEEATPEPARPTSPRPGAPLDAAAEFTRASGLESTDPAAADRVYRRVQRAGGPWAANALYARGRLAAEHTPSRARALLGQYVQRYPNGLNAGDARRLLRSLEDN